MEKIRTYYEAYDDRYSQVHRENLRWASDQPTPIVAQTIGEFGISTDDRILELGCGEGRDAAFLMNKGYQVLATDISAAAVEYCRKIDPEHDSCYQVLDCVKGQLVGKYSFIYAVAVVHMLVEDQDRDGFYRFIREHLADDGIALICTMGDGEIEVRSNTDKAFERQERLHQETGRVLKIAGTSCRMVNFETFRLELARNSLELLKEGITSAEPDFDKLMFAVVRKS